MEKTSLTIFLVRFLAYISLFLKYFCFYFFKLIKSWWWLILPFILKRPFQKLYLWHLRENWFNKKVKYVLLEIKLPKEIERPFKAAEEMMAGIHAIHDVFDWREVWLEGKFQLSLSFEIVSDGGDIHFYIWTPTAYRDLVESNIYAQYPDVEIEEVEDYTKKIPHNIPNENWDLFGFDEVTTKPNPYPIKTYKYFEEHQEIKGEKRVDPLAGFLEGMSTLKPGEYLWYQIWVKPIREEIPWRKEGLEIVNKLVKRPGPPKSKSIVSKVADLLFHGIPPEAGEEKKEGESTFISFPEMTLTPREREIVKQIEEKIAKFGYESLVRFLYLGKKDVFFKAKARIPFGFFKEISWEDLNGLKPNTKTMPKVHSSFMEKRRVYWKKRRLFRAYVKRLPTLYPRPGGTYVLNTEELATLYHFPGKTVAPAPTIKRIESKRREPPPILPRE